MAGPSPVPGEIWRDGDGLLIEQFRRFDNLMIEGGLLGIGRGAGAAGERTGGSHGGIWGRSRSA